jgi:hypothetical protein
MTERAFQHLPNFIYHQSTSPVLAKPTPPLTQTNLIYMPFLTTTQALNHSMQDPAPIPSIFRQHQPHPGPCHEQEHDQLLQHEEVPKRPRSIEVEGRGSAQALDHLNGGRWDRRREDQISYNVFLLNRGAG